MQDRGSKRPVSQPRESRHMTIDATAIPVFEIGARVFHQKFGYGQVMEVEGDKLDIEFDKAGRKRVVAGFVTSPDDIPF